MIAQLPNVRLAVQWNRSRAAIGRLVAGLEIIEPGLAWPPEWRPDPGGQVPANAAESYYCVVVARKP